MTRVCKSCFKEKNHEEFVKNPRCKFGITYKCKQCFNQQAREKYPDQKEKIFLNQKKSRLKRRSEGKDVNKAAREYSRRNPEYKRFYAAQRKNHVKQATPSWLSPQQKAHIKRVYKMAQFMKRETGLDYHVDHIIPLRGKCVCGLHVPENLRVLRADLNVIKSNIYS